MEFRILGPLEVLDGGRRLALPRQKERVVLAVLLLHANELVSRERLIDELWGEAPPPTARKALSVYVSQLRKRLTLNGDDPIVSADGGYRLDVQPDALDAVRAHRLLDEARELAAGGRLETAAREFREAVSLWRGPTLAGLQLESLGRDEVAELDELRLLALMDRIDCDLALGRHEQVLGELNVLVHEHPLRERLRGQQMLALYRADRQADALAAYAEARRTLVDELGLEPSEALQRLQQAILRHDEALETPAGTAAVNGTPTPVAARRRRYLLAAVAVLVLAAVAAVAVATTGGGRHPSARPAPQVAANSVVQIDPQTGKVVADIPAGIEPGPMALTGNGLWVVSRGNGTVARYDLRTRREAVVGVSSSPYDVAADADGNVWVANRRPVVTWILRTASGTGTSAVPWLTEDVAVPLPGAGAEAVGAGYLWVIPGPAALRRDADRVSLIDVRSRRLHSSIRVAGQTTAIAFGYGSAWIGTYDRARSSASLSIIRPGSSGAESVPLETGDGWGPLGIATGAGSVWVLTSAGTLLRIDPETAHIVKRIPLAAKQPAYVAVGDGAVWTANVAGFSVSRIDPRTDRVVRTFPLGGYTKVPCGIEATRDALWVAVGDAYCDGVNR
jgi:DNA-binding SARP family transcriptional activator